MFVFEEIEQKIRRYIEANLPVYLERENLDDMDNYVNDFLDFDKYKSKKTLFYNFGSYYITPYTNENERGQFSFDIFLAFRGNTAENLRADMLEYSSLFYEMFKNSGFNFGGAVDLQMNTELYFYNAAEGNTNLKVAAFTFMTATEM